jgi:hypothetical protein
MVEQTTDDRDEATVVKELDKQYKLKTDHEAGGSERKRGSKTLYKIWEALHKEASSIKRRASKATHTIKVHEMRMSKRQRRTQEKARRIEATGQQNTRAAQPRRGNLGTVQQAQRSQQLQHQVQQRDDVLRARFTGERPPPQLQTQQPHTRQSIVQPYSRGLQMIREPLRLRRLVEQRRLELAVARELGIMHVNSRVTQLPTYHSLTTHQPSISAY